MRKHHPVRMAQRRHHMRGLAVVEGVEAAAQRLAVDGDGGQPLRGRRRRQANGMASKRGLQRLGVDALQNEPQPGVGRRIRQFEPEGFVETLAMDTHELVHLPIGIGAGDHGEDRVEQHRGQVEALAFPATMLRNGPQNLQERDRHATTSDSGCRP